MAAIYCAAVIFVLSLCGVCISQKVENERLERELREARAEIDNLQDEREQQTDRSAGGGKAHRRGIKAIFHV